MLEYVFVRTILATRACQEKKELSMITRLQPGSFVTQGVGPEMLRATYMRVSKFFLFPIAHRGLFTTEPTLGTVTTKAVAAGVCSLPEGLTIAPIETAKIGLQLDTANTYKNNMTAFIKTTMQQVRVFF